MTVLAVIAVLWLVLSTPAAILLGRAINRADREQEAERAAREAAMLRHPSGRAA